MPTKSVLWAEDVLPVCVVCGDEPWGPGVWPKGEHAPGCSWHDSAEVLLIEWSPAELCDCD